MGSRIPVLDEGGKGIREREIAFLSLSLSGNNVPARWRPPFARPALLLPSLLVAIPIPLS